LATRVRTPVDKGIHGIRTARGAPRSRHDPALTVDAAFVDLEGIAHALMRAGPWSVQRDVLSATEALCEYLADWSGLSSERIWHLAVASVFAQSQG